MYKIDRKKEKQNFPKCQSNPWIEPGEITYVRDERRFIKMYKKGVDCIRELSTPGIRIYIYICYMILRGKEAGYLYQQRKPFLLKITPALTRKYLPDIFLKMNISDIYKGIQDCIKAEIIFRLRAEGTFAVSPMVAFRGDRQSAIKKHFSDPLDFSDQQYKQAFEREKMLVLTQQKKKLLLNDESQKVEIIQKESTPFTDDEIKYAKVPIILSDTENFIKIYKEGIMALNTLTKVARKLLVYILRENMRNANRDWVYLNYRTINSRHIEESHGRPYPKATYYNGRNNCLENQWIRNDVNDTHKYYFNIGYFYNGELIPQGNGRKIMK